MATPLLSIGMIIKNEMRCLERCLQSLDALRKTIPCQLVIADTGSTDGSREVAERYADILLDFAWVNDFAAARNAVLERCTGMWYLTIDADEWLEDIGELVDFLTGPEGKSFNMAMVYQCNYGDPLLLQYSNSLVPRMGQLRGGKLRYQYPIHEVLYFTDNAPFNTKLLENTFLHHDGYVDMGDGGKEAKGRRNMELLRVEQEKHPQDLRTLCQCIQSAVDNEERYKYINLALNAAEQADAANSYLPVLYQLCLHVYTLIPDYEPVEPCLKKALAACPGSYLLRLDGEAFAAIAAHNMGRWSEAREHVSHWEAALAGLARHDDAGQPERLFSAYVTRSPFGQSMLRTLAVDTMIHMEDYEGAAQLLPQIHLELLVRQNALTLLNAVMCLASHLPHVAVPWIRNFWAYALEQSRENNDRRRENGEALLRFGEAIFRQQFPIGEDPKPAADVLAQVEDCTPGRCARVLLSTDPSAIEGIWAEETDWPRVFPEALLHCMELGLPFPPGLLSQRREALAQQAAQLVKVLGLPLARALAYWLDGQPAPETLADLLWRLDLVSASFQAQGWWEDEDLGRRLCGAYRSLSAELIARLYRPEVLNEVDIAVLPGMHRFAWYCARAWGALEKGDELGYVRGLRAGLDTAPAMKRAVEFMLDHRPASQPTPELLALARQVRDILARYPAGDPAVAALKQSEAYQKVAYLLETPGPSALPLEPADPDVEAGFSTLERDCAFTNLDQARGEISARFAQVSSINQKALRDYWTRFPLWGDSPERVLDHIAQAFVEHWQDFAWMYRHLADNRSRRTLLAVLRNWRYFDMAHLAQAVDTRFDDYFDREILSCGREDIIADLGAYVGDTFLSYVANYTSMGYRRYYCYEITPDSFDKLLDATRLYPRVICRRKGAGAGPGTMYLSANADSSANTLEGSGQEQVEMVALDDDIAERLTLIKMDIEGAEQAALQGCLRHVREDRPKLALSVYHNFENIWKLAQMVDEAAPGYRFYLRYHGGALWPSEITLLAIPT